MRHPRIAYLTVEEVMAKSKAWHAAREEAMSPTNGGNGSGGGSGGGGGGGGSGGGGGGSSSTAAVSAVAAAGAEWNFSYMRKQFPPSWFLSGDHGTVDYGPDSPVPLSYHGSDEMMSYLPTVLRPRHRPVERWTPDKHAAATAADGEAGGAGAGTVTAGGALRRPGSQSTGRAGTSKGSTAAAAAVGVGIGSNNNHHHHDSHRPSQSVGGLPSLQ